VQRKTQVLVVGAGLAGLTAALLLAWRGVSCVLVERRRTISRHPRARGVNFRTMELLRGVPGLEQALANAAPTRTGFSIVIAESVTGRVIKTLVGPGDFDTRSLSPSLVCTAGQDRIESVLAKYARQLGAEIRFGQELVEFVQDSESVKATIRNRDDANVTHMIADYMIGADGNRSPIRQALGIGDSGIGTISHNVSILFEADLDQIVGGDGFLLYYLQNPDFAGAFVTTDDPRIGQISVEYDPLRDGPADFDNDRAIKTVRAALGTPELEVKILDVMPWEMSAQCADRMAAGRVYLVGDAAHTMPPTGGLGGQTAMQDAGDIAWKIAAVLGGMAGGGLLDTYEAERLPVAALTVARQTANYVERLRPDRAELAKGGEENDYIGTATGYRYRSSAIIGEVPDDGRATENPFQSQGRPGTRLPHIVIQRNGQSLSTLDLAGRGFVLLAGPKGQAWSNAARHIGAMLRIDIMAYQMGWDFSDTGDFLQLTGLDADGALVARPDGFICWRSRKGDCDADASLAAVLSHILSKDTGLHEDAA
jgi:putative polyketide hydroxylase